MIYQDFPGPGMLKKKIQDFPGGVGTLLNVLRPMTMLNVQEVPRQMKNVVVSPFPTSTFRHEHIAWRRESMDVQRCDWRLPLTYARCQSARHQQANNQPIDRQTSNSQRTTAATATVIKCIFNTTKYDEQNVTTQYHYASQKLAYSANDSMQQLEQFLH